MYKKCLEILNTTKFFIFISITVANLFVLLIVLFYIVIGNSDVRENSSFNTTLTYIAYDKPQIEDFSQWNNNCDWMLTVVNEKNKVPLMYTNELVEFAGVDLDSRIISNLEEMIFDSKNNSGVNLLVSSGYRNAQQQDNRLKKATDENIQKGYAEDEARNIAELVVSKPEYSEHHLGLAVDFNGAKDDFASTEEFKWLLENSYKYGFILRYPQDKSDITGRSFKPWHFRYVGEKNAKLIFEQNLCLEEYISNVVNFGE